MDKIREKLLAKIRAHRLNGLELQPGDIFPYYDGLSLRNLPGSICAWLGAVPLGPPLQPEVTAGLRNRYRHVILVLADALGFHQLQTALERESSGQTEPAWHELAGQGTLAALTSITPSTTSAALTSLWTGQPPAGHGLTGYEIWLKDYSMIINAITHTPAVFSGDPGGLRRAGFDSQQFLGVPTLSTHLAGQGTAVYSYAHTSIHRSSLSQMLHPGAKTIPYRTLSDLWLTVENVLQSAGAERSYHYIYYGDLDELMHRYGPQDERVQQETAWFGRGLARLVRRLRGRGDTLLLLAADHGQIDTRPDPRYELRSYPELLDCLVMLPSGEPRLAYLYGRAGSVERIPELIEKYWPGEFSVYPSMTALQAGLLGEPVSARTRERVGDWMVAARRNAYLWWSAKENTMRGRHGGLTEEEMLAPLWMVEC